MLVVVENKEPHPSASSLVLPPRHKEAITCTFLVPRAPLFRVAAASARTTEPFSPGNFLRLRKGFRQFSGGKREVEWGRHKSRWLPLVCALLLSSSFMLGGSFFLPATHFATRILYIINIFRFVLSGLLIS